LASSTPATSANRTGTPVSTKTLALLFPIAIRPPPGPPAPDLRPSHIHTAAKRRTGTTQDRSVWSHVLSTRPAKVTPYFSRLVAISGLTRVVTKRCRPWYGASCSGSFSSPWIESASMSTSFTFCCSRSCWNLL
jgi:hypothetical protein